MGRHLQRGLSAVAESTDKAAACLASVAIAGCLPKAGRCRVFGRIAHIGLSITFAAGEGSRVVNREVVSAATISQS